VSTVNGYTAEHMQAIEDATIVSMTVDGTGHLIVTRHDGSTFDAGSTIASGNFASVTETFAGTEPAKAIPPLSIAQLTAGVVMSSTQDLDLMVKNGMFQSGTQTNATVAKHFPQDNIGGVLIVQGEAAMVSQIYVPRPGYTNINNAIMWQRAKFSTNAWSPWYPIVADAGYRLAQTVILTSSGTFSKASYPGIRAIRVKTIGGGGAGGGAPTVTTSGNHTAGGGGGGGGYAEAFLLASALASSETVTIGAGGTGVSGTTGGNGGASSFGSWCAAGGGLGGTSIAQTTLLIAALGGAGGAGTAGDLQASGSPGEYGGGNATLGIGGAGGSSLYGGGGLATYTGAGGGSLAGNNGVNYGGGGSGAQANSPTGAAKAGGNGAAGVVIVEVYV
jgi:hypothetical protein